MRKLASFLIIGVTLLSLTGCELALMNDIIGTWESEQTIDGVKYQEIISFTNDKKFTYVSKIDGAAQKSDSGDYSIEYKVFDGTIYYTLVLGDDSVGILFDETSSTGRFSLFEESYGKYVKTDYLKIQVLDDDSSEQ